MKNKKLKVAVFASGNGSNFQAIVSAIKNNKLRVDLALLVCDNPQGFVLERAKKAGVKTALIKREDFSAKKDFENKILECVLENKIELIVLAGFMRMLSEGFVSRFKNKILNIHPSLLPAFKGAEAIKDAFDYGAKVTGVTVHFADTKMDHGPIILQEEVKLGEKETLESLEKKIHKIEHRLYPEAIRLFSQGKLKIEGRKVKVI